MSDTLRIVAILTAKPGKEQELKSMLEGLIAPTHAEDGCISYEMHSNNENPREFVFIEEWANEAALGAHFETSHIQGILAAAPDLLEKELDLRKLTQVK